MSTQAALDTREQVLREIRAGERFAIASHEHLDGDAIGSLVAMQGIMRALGKDCVMVIAPEEFPLPQEYRIFALDGLATAPPADLDQRTMIFLDCGNLDRNPLAALRDATPLLNIDHHHDNTRFGTVDHVVENRVVHRGDHLGPDRRPRGGADAADRRGPLHRAGHRYGQVFL